MHDVGSQEWRSASKCKHVRAVMSATVPKASANSKPARRLLTIDFHSVSTLSTPPNNYSIHSTTMNTVSTSSSCYISQSFNR